MTKKVLNLSFLFCGLSVFAYLCIPAPLNAQAVRGIAGDLWADVVLGKPDYGIPNSGFGDVQFDQATTQSAFHLGGTVVDRVNGVMYIWDSGNNRILGVSIIGSSSDPGPNQDVVPFMVLGQPDFFHTGCNHDSNWQNYPIPPAASPDCLCGTSYSLQSLAEAGSKANMDVDSQGNLYVPDYFNNRVVRYNAQPNGSVTSLEPATYEWGQPDFTGWAVNDVGGNVTGAPNSQNFYLSPVPPGGGAGYFPLGTNTASSGVAIDAWGNLWVADDWNARVLRFPSPGGTCCAAPAATADVVLGQSGFTTNSTTYLAQPIAVRVDRAGNVYVVSYNSSLVGTLFIYKPTTPGNGATQPIYGSGDIPAAAMTLSNIGGAESEGEEWDASGPNGIGGAPALSGSGGLWVANLQEIDLLKVSLSASDNITWSIVKTLMNDTPGDTTGSPVGDNNFTFANVGGDGINSTQIRQPAIESPGVDASGNVYWINPYNNECDGIFRFPGPIPAPVSGVVHSADVEILKPFQEGLEDIPDYHGMRYTAGVAVASFQGVTQVVEASDMLRFWNMPSTGPAGFSNGQKVDGLIGAPSPSQPLVGPSGGFGRVKADRMGHLWALANGQHSVWVYQLPLMGQESPFLTLSLTQPIPLLGGGSVSLTDASGQAGSAHCEGMAVAPDASYLWVTDQYASRVMRIRNPVTSPVVDIILGQPNATSTTVDYPGGTPANNNMNNPGSAVLDQYGNLFVGDHSLEFNGDGRILMYSAASIQNSGATPLYAVSATMVYNALGPWEPALSPGDTVMTAGSDAQSGGSVFTMVFQNPLGGGANPVTYLKDYGPQDYSETFDDQGNLYVANHNRSRVLIYLQPFPVPTATATSTGSWTPTLTLTSTPSNTPILTATPTVSFTATASPSSTATPTPTFTWNSAVPTFTPTSIPNCCLTAWTVTSGPLPDVDGLAYDPSGPATLYAGGGATILGLNPANGAILNNSMPASFDSITAMAMGGDGYLYVADYNSKVFKAQLPSGNIVETFSIPENGVRSLSVAPGSSYPEIYAGCDSGNLYLITQSASTSTLAQLSFSTDASPVHQGAPGILYVPGNAGAPSTLYLSDGDIAQRVLQYLQAPAGSNTYAYHAFWQTSNGNDYMGRIVADAFGNVFVGAVEDYYTFDPNFNFRWSCAIAPVYGQSIAVDPAGNVYAGHTSMDTIIKLHCSVPESTATFTYTPTVTPTYPPAPILSCPLVGTPLAVSQPWGAALDTGGNLYVVNSSVNAVDTFNSVDVPGPALSLGPEALPVGVAMDANGYAYVTDEQQNMVDVFNASGSLVLNWGTSGSGGGQFEAPYGIAVTTGSSGTTVFVADSGNQRMQEFLVTTTGIPAVSTLTAWGFPGVNGDGSFLEPAGVALNGQGEVYVADGETGIVQVFDGTGKWKRQWDATLETSLLTANFLATTGDCLVFVTDGFSSVGVFDPNGTVLGVVSGPGTGANFYDTEGVAAGNGGWFVADGSNGQVYSFGTCPAASCWTIVRTPTPTRTPTASPTITPTFTTTATATITPTATLTNSPTVTLTFTPSETPTITLTYSPTLTPTLTGTPTLTNTPLITSTPTISPTPGVTGVVIGPPYPNPVMGSGPVSLQLQVPLGSTVEWSVFTTAFRKVLDNSNPVSGNSSILVWDLEDAWKRPVANGLYYLRVQVSGPVKTSKVLKVLVIQ